MADKTSLSERFTVALAALGALQVFNRLSEYANRVFSPNQSNQNSAVLGRDSQEKLDKAINTEAIEAKLGLRDSRKQLNKINPLVATGAALLIGSVDQEAVNRRLQEQKATQQASQSAFQANREAAVLADKMRLKTAGLVSPEQDAATVEKAAEKVMGDVARRGSDTVVIVNAPTVFDMTQENKGVEQAVETTRMSAAEERLKELQEMVIATKGENLDVLMQYGNALHAKVYQPSDETGYNAPNAETIGQYANAINLIKRCQENEAANTMTMQPA
jgi:hypothetical protein